jgi:general secretion pathway protein F
VRRPAFSAWFWRQTWRLPVAGERFRQHQLARLYRSLAMLLRSGTAIAEALDMVPGLVDVALRPQVIGAARAIRDGRSIRDAMESSALTTPVAVRMLRVGERAGNMDEMMEHIADFLDEETARALAAFVRVFEPGVMALIGLLVGGIVVLLYIPIFELAGSLQS